MAFIGISLILASLVYIAIRRPPLMETLLALWRGDPKIERPPTTTTTTTTTTRSPPPPPPPPSRRTAGDDDHGNGSQENPTRNAPPIATPPPPPTITKATDEEGDDDDEPSPQTTPKASATHLTDSGVPTFTLTPEPPASAAAVARSRSSSLAGGAANAQPPSLSGAGAAPVLGAMAPPPPPPPPSLSAPSKPMPPPPPPSSLSSGMRPPTLKPTPNSGSSSLSIPGSGRPSPLPQRTQARQPGTSTLAPPPTHNSKPTKASSSSSSSSRKVILEPGCSPLDWARLADSPTSDLRGLPAGTPYLRVPPSLLKQQNGRRGRDAWTAMGGRVYNITPYLRFHPGGEGELLRGAGRDSTRLFGEVHPWVNYETMLASCLVGVLVAEGDVGNGRDGGGNGEMDEMD